MRDVHLLQWTSGRGSGSGKVEDERMEEAGRSAEVVVPPTVYEWGNGGEGGSQTLGHASLKCGKVMNLSPI